VTASALLDTSFLISLVDQNRPNHQVAVQYYRYMLDQNIQMYFSAIVASEFSIKQPISDLPLKNFRAIPFNIVHGREAGRLWNALGQRDEGDSRVAVRDDVKLIAQANHESIQFLLTEDKSTLHKYCERLRVAGESTTKAVKLVDGQRGLDLDGE
jgi:hypothetical protein